MAAILNPAPHHLTRFAGGRHRDRFGPPARHAVDRHAVDLRIIEGGRSARRLAQRRLVAGVLLAVLAVATLLGGRALLAQVTGPLSVPASTNAPSDDVVTVEVRAGDSLWSLARRVRPGDDIRPVVDSLSATRGDAPLQVGERISVPVG